MDALSQAHLIRGLIWDEIRAEIGLTADASASLRSIAPRLLQRYPGSGLTADELASEFDRIRAVRRLDPRGLQTAGLPG